jgi:hypothetical protein
VKLRAWLTQRRNRRAAERLVAEIRQAQAMPARLLIWSGSMEVGPLGTLVFCHRSQEPGRGAGLGWMAYRLDRALQNLPVFRRWRPGLRLFLAYHRTRHRLVATLLLLSIPPLWRALLNRSLARSTPWLSR